VLGMVDALRWVHEDTDEIHGYELPAHSRSKFVLAAASAAVSAKFARLSREACRLSPLIPKRPIVDQNFVLCQPLRPARKRAGSWSRGAYGIFPDRSRLVHTAHGIPSPGPEQRREQWVGSGQGFAWSS
jgi:hypothetical protein